jgi:hypothetical protein
MPRWAKIVMVLAIGGYAISLVSQLVELVYFSG